MKYTRSLAKLPFLLAGNLLLAFGVVAFILPGGLITGGATGLALFFYHQFAVPVELFTGAFNLVMFVLGAVVLGKAFALTAVFSTVVYPIFLSLFQRVEGISNFTDNPMLLAVYGGAFMGLGIGLVLRVGGSTGGMDIPPLVLSHKTGISVSVLLYGFDTGILLLQAFFSTSEQVLYGLLVVLISSFTLHKVLMVGKSQVQVTIISPCYEKINHEIQTTLDRGSTLLQAVTGHLGAQQMVIMSVVSARELPRLTQLVTDIDPKAFVVVSHVNEVRGRGFTLRKINL